MSSRNLELTVRAKADTRDLEKLSRELGTLITDLRKSDAAFDATGDSAKKMVGTISQLTAEEMKHIQAASRTVTALEQAATARERSNRAAADALGAEQRMSTAQEQSAQAAIRTAAAQERLRQAQSNTVAVAARTASAEERLAQEREKTLQATSKTEKAELDVARAREQLRAATVRAEQAEKKAAETKRSYGLATDMVRKQIAAFVSGAALVQAGRMMLNFGRDAVNAASDVEEGAAKFQQVFGNLSDGVEKDLQRMADANRRSLYDLKDFASELQNTFVPLGFAREQASAFAQTITQLGIDIAAFSNKADADVIHNLTSAIVGNHEAVRSYGIVLTQTVINQELAANGWDKLTGAALETAKAQARLNIIMRASADAQGAAVREADSYTNTLKAWDAAVLDLKVSVGEGLLPAMTGLTEAGIKLAKFMQTGKVFRVPHEEALESAKTIEAIVQVIKNAQKDLEGYNFWEKLFTTVEDDASALQLQAIQQLATKTKDYGEFQKVVGQNIDENWIAAVRLNSEIYKMNGPKLGAMFTDADENLRLIYDIANAQQAMTLATSETTEMEAAYQALLAKRGEAAGQKDFGKLFSTGLEQANIEKIMGAWAAAAEDIGQYTAAAHEASLAALAAAEAQKEWNAAWGELFKDAPVDDLIAAQQDLRAATGEWRTATIDNSGDIAAIQRQLAADLTAEQKSELQKQLKDLDSFSDEYLAIVGRLEGDLSDRQRLDLSQQLAALEGRQGEATRAYTGDIEAAEDAREAIIAANKAIQDSYYERAYNSIAAKLIEEGNFKQMADLAVSLGLMSEQEAALRTQYAETGMALDALAASTAFYGLTAEQQAGAIKSLAAGIYETADAAIKAQEELKKTQEFYNSAPDSTAIGDYYRDLAQGVQGQGAITAAVGVKISPTDQAAFIGFRSDLETFAAAPYTAVIQEDGAAEAQDDFEKMHDVLSELVRSPWTIQVRYQTEGTPPTGGGDGGGGSTTPRSVDKSGAYVDLVVNNYGGGPSVEGAVRNGVMAAFRSMG